MLERDSAALGNAREDGVVNDRLAVQHHRQMISFEGDHEAIPLADGFVGEL